MLQDMLYSLPEISLIFGIINLVILHIFSNENPKVFAKVTRLWIMVSIFFSIMFYDKTFNNTYFESSSYTLLFKLLIAFFSYIMVILSPSWFVTENKTGCKYLILILSSLVINNLLISSSDIIVYICCYAMTIYINYRLLDISYDKYPSEISRKYLAISSIILLLMVSGFAYFIINGGFLTNLNQIKEFLMSSKSDIKYYIAVSLIIIPVFYTLGLAPFHSLIEDKIGKSILPVSHYFSIILPITFWGVLLKLKQTLLLPFEESISPVLIFIAVFSILLGAIGANARINLYRIFAYGSMYHFGVCVLMLSFFTHQADFGLIIYLLMYLLALNGAYTVFYNLKSRGEFLSAITSLSGLAKTRPFTTRALLISIFSIIGIPPFAGFLAKFYLLNELILHKKYILLAITLLFFLVLAKSYLEIIKTAYFEQKMKNYDTENKIILLTTLASITLIAIISFNPFGIIEKIKDMFYVIYS